MTSEKSNVVEFLCSGTNSCLCDPGLVTCNRRLTGRAARTGVAQCATCNTGACGVTVSVKRSAVSHWATDASRMHMVRGLWKWYLIETSKAGVAQQTVTPH